MVATAFAVLLAAEFRRWWKSNLADTVIVRVTVAALKLTIQTILSAFALVVGAFIMWGAIRAGIWSEDGEFVLGGVVLFALGGWGVVDLALKARAAWLKMRAAP